MSGAAPGLTPRRLGLAIGAALAGLAAAFVVALASGPSGLGISDTVAALGGRARDAATADIVLRVRLPRVALAGIVGAALATSGALFQALLRNPLADPFVLGVSGGAALGGIIVLGLGAAASLAQGAVPAASFAGALAALLLLFALAGARGRLSSTSLLLTGVVFNAFASAAIVFIASVAGLAEGTSIFLWLIGSLSSAPGGLVGLVGSLVGLAIVFTLPLARQLDLLALGEEPAAQLGVEVERVRRWLLVASSLMVGAAVAVSGLIGFVGLIIPHALRLAIGPDHRILLPTSALGGAAFLILCDTAARTVLPGRELPVGAVTALAGGPLFLVLLRRQQGRPLLP
ncbi:MAG TPA: iron ABC transporter permease [Myxococcota bacterium]|nr:iron ABC transporter permease [Myxococcota bacterium]